MASATKCDRCGKCYDANRNELIGKKKNYAMTGVSALVRGANFVNKHYDLCDECCQDFIEFMDGREISEAGRVR